MICMRCAVLLLIMIVASGVAPAAIDEICAGQPCCAKTVEDGAVKAPSCCDATNCSPRTAQAAEGLRNGVPDHPRPLSSSSRVPAALHVGAQLNLVTAAIYPADGVGSPTQGVVTLSTLRI